jgi:predicted phage terminase large subunit-like protein
MNSQTRTMIAFALLRQDLGVFVAQVFGTVSPGDPYLHNWHIDAIVHQLLRIDDEELRRLIITQPPRSLKTICVSIAFIAWKLGHDPSLRFACVSYSNELAATFHRMFRLVVASEWYRQLFPGVVIAKDTENELVTSKGGGRYATSVGGTMTGRGFDFIIIDDPLKADDAHSESARPKSNEYFKNTLLSRLDNPDKGVFILVCQRLHEEDLAGSLLEQGGWYHLNLSAIAEEDQKIQIGPNAWHRRSAGDVLHPERQSAEMLEALKRELGSLTFSAQYQQSPIPAEGNLVRREWLQFYEEFTQEPDQIVQSWDVASTTSQTSSYSVCTTWAVIGNRYYLLDVWRDRIEFPKLRQKVIDHFFDCQANVVLIEKAGIGQHLFQELVNADEPGFPRPIAIRPEGDKIVRLEGQSTRFEAGQVFLPLEAPWLDLFLNELLAFPNARHDDQVDSVSQFLKWRERRWHSSEPTDYFMPTAVYMDR